MPPPAQTPSPAPPPGVDIQLGGAGILAAGAMLPALMQLFDRKAVDRDSHLQRLEFIGSRYLPRCRETLLELGLDEASKLFEEAVDPVEFRVRVTDANAISTVIYREIARQCALGLQALLHFERAARLGDLVGLFLGLARLARGRQREKLALLDAKDARTLARALWHRFCNL